MNYHEESVKLLNSITQERVLQFFYALLRVATSDPDMFEDAFAAMGDLFEVAPK